MTFTNLIHGDCLQEMKQIPDGSIDCIIADLPYGRTGACWNKPIPFEPLWEQFERIVKGNAPILLFGSELFASQLICSKPKWYRYKWYWIKDNNTGFLNSKRMPLRLVEEIIVFSPKRNAPYYPERIKKEKPWVGTMSQKPSEMYGDIGSWKMQTPTVRTHSFPKNVLHYPLDRPSHHSCQKPVALVEYLLKTYTLAGQTVLDPTMGAGTTGIACRNLGRKFVGIEKSALHFNRASDRISA